MSKLDGRAVDHASVLEVIPQPIAVCGVEGQVLYLNATARQFLGVEQGDKLPRFALTDRDTFSQVRFDTSGLHDEYFMADVVIDGAQRRRASMSLSPIEGDRYRVLLEAAPRAMVAPVLDELDALVAICDERRRIRLSNAALNKVTDTLTDDDSPLDFLELFEPSFQPQLRVLASQALAGGTPDEVVSRLVARGVPLGGGEVRVRIRPLVADDKNPSHGPGRGFLMVAQAGEASFVELQEKFARAEELMSLGELATGVAHELKNPLTSIINYAEFLMRKYGDKFEDPTDANRLQRIIDGVERIDCFVRDLLSLAGADEMEMVGIDLHAVLRGATALHSRALEERDVEVSWDLRASRSEIAGHTGGLKQVFSNLVLNAARALGAGGGEVTIRSYNDEETIAITVEDRGRGMSPEVQARIFEPFYSATPEGGGAGLGLALVRRIVEEHQGTIEVQSSLGQGSCFTVVLPVVVEE